MTNEDAFVRAFRAEMDEAAHQALVDTYVWMHSTHYGTPPDDLKRRAEEWATSAETAGVTWPVLSAVAER